MSASGTFMTFSAFSWQKEKVMFKKIDNAFFDMC